MIIILLNFSYVFVFAKKCQISLLNMPKKKNRSVILVFTQLILAGSYFAPIF